MVAHGTPCLGPVTHAGCGALCPAYDRGCYGCFGPMETPNTASLADAAGRARRDRARPAPALPHLQRRRRAVPRRRPSAMARKTIKVDNLARVEGEGALTVVIRDDQVTERRAAHLRAAALLRGVPARPRLQRGARHHRAHLRHLPGRLPDERGARDGGRARRHGRRADCARCAGCSIAASGSRATRCTSTCCTRPISSATRTRIEMAQDHGDVVQARPRAEEGRQRPDDASSAAARSIRSTCASAASTRRRRSASSWTRPRR